MGNSVPNRTYSNYTSEGHWYSVFFDDEHFAEGYSRYAYRGVIESNGPLDGKEVVAKIFKTEYCRDVNQYAPDLTASRKAQVFAEKFNDHAKRAGVRGRRRITFKIPILLKVDDVRHFKFLGIFPIGRNDNIVKRGDYVAVEDFIRGKYVKFNSNGGYEDRSLSEYLLAFSHWTFDISNGKFMICDLQGVETEHGFYLTDPAVHSREQIYGATDLGIVGMIMVFLDHECNHYCRQFGLSNPLQSENRVGRRRTFYSFQLPQEEKLRMIRKYGPKLI